MTDAANNGLGLIHGLPSDLYHADTGSVSNSMLSAMNKSPAHCYWLHLEPGRPKIDPTPARLAGTLAHTAILEYGAFQERYVEKPDGMRFSTKEGIAWRDAQSRQIISRSDRETAEAQRVAIYQVPALADLLSSGRPEMSAFWVDKQTGLRCRARPDWMHMVSDKRAVVLDIKTVADLTPDYVARSVAKYGYHRQAAHYSNGVRACGIEVQEFVFGFVSASYPFLAAAFVLDDESLQQGQDEVAELLERFAECKRSAHWPAFGDGCQLIGLPAYARRSGELEVSYA
jgi:hypothetical protein